MKDFKIIRNLYDVKTHRTVPDLFQYTKNIKHLGMIDDTQSLGSPSFYKNREMSKIQYRILPKIEREIKLRLYPTYNYFRVYNSESTLPIHIDREECEISITLNLGYDGDYNWPIWIRDSDNIDHEVTLEPGDGLIYKGFDLKHWREPADERVICQSQLFMHFVDQNGPYENLLLDEDFWEKRQNANR